MSTSRITLGPSEMNSDGRVTEVVVWVDRDDEPDDGLAFQCLVLTPGEMQALYYRMQVYYDQGTWSGRRTER
jgi:hypothetical protein